MKSKLLAIFGIVSYILSVLSSATDLEGNSSVPSILIIVSGIATALFIVAATIYLWRKSRNLAIILITSNVILFVLMLLVMLASPSYGSPIIILMSIFKVITLVVLIAIIIKLFKLPKAKTETAS